MRVTMTTAFFFRIKDPEYIDTAGESSDDEYDLLEAGLSESDASAAEYEEYEKLEDDEDEEDEEDEEASNVDVSLLDGNPNDITRHRQTLLEQAPGKVWTEKDLATEQFLVLGLRLLYNKINGLDLLHLKRSIHIHYKQFPKKTIARVKSSNSRAKKTRQKQGQRVFDGKSSTLWSEVTRDLCLHFCILAFY
ncbi:hypothetical protein BJX62DRAFT_7481 [Aspergillus germanicus]